MQEKLNHLVRVLERICQKVGAVKGSRRFPERTDPGNIFRSKVDYGYVCQVCGEPILIDDMIVAFRRSPEATKTTYMHVECDDFIREA